jgi:ribosomal protein L29
MKKSNFKNKEEGELMKTLGEKREELRGARFASAGARVRDLKAYRASKKDVARILTVLNSRSTKA